MFLNKVVPYLKKYTKKFLTFFLLSKKIYLTKKQEIFIVLLCLYKHQGVASLKLMYNGSFIKGNFQHSREDECIRIAKKLTFLKSVKGNEGKQKEYVKEM